MVKNKKTVSVILSLLMLISLISGATATKAASYKTVEGNYNYSYASEVLTLVNSERAKNGLQPLTMTQGLTDGAMLRAAETAVSFSHTRPNGEQCFTAFEWTRTAGENIAYGQRSPAQVMNGWMNSSGHRANILNSSFTTIGIGCFEYGGTLYWAQAFSGGSGSSYSASGKKAVRVEVSLTAGSESKVSFINGDTASTTAQQTTTKSSTTKESTTKAPTTKAPTTKAPSTTKQPTTKAETTNQETTTAASTTKKTTVNKKGIRGVFSRIRYYITYLFK